MEVECSGQEVTGECFVVSSPDEPRNGTVKRKEQML